MYDEPMLYDALKASYGNKESQFTLERFGYHRDDSVSNHNEQVY